MAGNKEKKELLITKSLKKFKKSIMGKFKRGLRKGLSLMKRKVILNKD